MKIKIISAMVLATMASPPAWAADCKPLSYFTGVPMNANHGVILVPVGLNGKPEIAMFDSGGLSNNIAPAKAAELGLTPRESRLTLLNVAGGGANGFVKINEFSLGALKVPDMQLQIAPVNVKGVPIQLSNSFFYMFDVDMDFGGHRMNFFLPDHCPGNVIYWPSDGIAEIPITLEDTKMKIPVRIDGSAMTATIDTGTTSTTMSLAVAQRRLGLSPGTNSSDIPHANGDGSLPLYEHRFSTLELGGVTVRNPAVMLMPDKINSREKELIPASHMQSRTLVLPDLIIGLDILTKLHLYVSYKEHMLYVGAADDKAAKLLPPPIGAPVQLPTQGNDR